MALTAGEIRAVVHARHPYLRRRCNGPVWAYPSALTTTVAGRRVVIATGDCRNGTTGTPTDIGVYTWRKTHLRQLYLLRTGRPLTRGRLSITASFVTVHAATATVHYGGLAPGRPLCCASRSYHRTFRLGRRSADGGALVADHDRRILGPG